jgi:hypothetical protein
MRIHSEIGLRGERLEIGKGEEGLGGGVIGMFP